VVNQCFEFVQRSFACSLHFSKTMENGLVLDIGCVCIPIQMRSNYFNKIILNLYLYNNIFYIVRNFKGRLDSACEYRKELIMLQVTN
jgi:hypothetical protein